MRWKTLILFEEEGSKIDAFHVLHMKPYCVLGKKNKVVKNMTTLVQSKKALTKDFRNKSSSRAHF